jgi:hypothetical protein
MSTIEEFQAYDSRLRNAKRWASLIGSPYSGGGGGVGKIAHTTHCRIEVYHQEYDGAHNYHTGGKHFEGGDEFQRFLNEALIELGPQVIAIAIKKMEAKRTELARQAKDEAEAVLSAATAKPEEAK